MAFEFTTLEKLDALYDRGREFVESSGVHGAVVEYQFDVCAFDKWRRKVNDLLFSLGSCEDINYQRFSKEVVRPHINDLEKGLRVLADVRDNLAGSSHARASSPS
jgi:hypothetical protein